MKTPRFPLKSTRLRIVAIVLIAITVFTITVAAVYYGSTNADCGALASGKLSVIWGDPYRTPIISMGTGSEALTVAGHVEERPDLPGYYVYTTMTVHGSLHVQWSNATHAYALNVNFSLVDYQTPYQRITVNPAANSFAVSYSYFTGTLTVDGVTNQITGTAGMIAAAPGYFTFNGQARATSLVLYAPSLGLPQFVFRWSEATQTIDGLEQPAADQFSQTVILS